MNLARGVITIGLSLYFSATSASKLALSDAKASSASNRNTEQMVSYVQAKLSAGSGACGKMAPQAASLLEQGKAAESGGVGVHIAAVGEYEDDDQLVWVGLNIHKLDFLGECVAPPCVSMCWCDDGPFLSVRGFAYKITSIMQNGNSLCMGKCNIYDKLATDLARGTNEYVIQIAQLQNAPIRLRTVPLPEPVNLAAAGGPLHYNVEFLKGDMGILVPGWICINCQHGIGAVGPETPIPSPLSLWVSDLNVGCISGIATSTEGVSPITRVSLPIVSIGAVPLLASWCGTTTETATICSALCCRAWAKAAAARARARAKAKAGVEGSLLTRPRPSGTATSPHP
eukprot:TRINITY_DN17387_c0_g1_i2.p1 TRINITY_DN17387_c0_g1~~TRINITY_DN17387_c0_g1_i2.p1  ORF type:complete len:342 (-),score=35.47 TRINITY_DN17387_c0_g1_i2:30-1055(-)